MVSKRKDNIPSHPESAFEWLLGPKSTFRLQLEIGVSRAGETPLTIGVWYGERGTQTL